MINVYQKYLSSNDIFLIFILVMDHLNLYVQGQLQNLRLYLLPDFMVFVK